METIHPDRYIRLTGGGESEGRRNKNKSFFQYNFFLKHMRESGEIKKGRERLKVGKRKKE